MIHACIQSGDVIGCSTDIDSVKAFIEAKFMVSAWSDSCIFVLPKESSTSVMLIVSELLKPISD